MDVEVNFTNYNWFTLFFYNAMAKNNSSALE